MKVREMYEEFERRGLERGEILYATEEAYSYGTNCFDLIFCFDPYVAVRFHYYPIQDEIEPIAIIIVIKKEKDKNYKDLVETLLPFILAAEEDEELLKIYVKPPKASAKALLDKAIEIADSVVKYLNKDSEVGILAYRPTECEPRV